MNIVKIIKTTILSILLVGSSVLAKDNCDYTFPTVKLCSTHICPNDYHLCNSFDSQTIIQTASDNYFHNVTDTYFTGIANNGENCVDSPTSDAISISAIMSDDYVNTCTYNNKVIKYGEGILVDKCIFCTCSKDSSKCINTCKYSKYLSETNTFREVKHNALNIPNKVSMRCNDVHHTNKLVCCKNDNCKMPGCISCMSYGDQEMCNRCSNGYYFNQHFKTRCYTNVEIDYLCDGFFTIDESKQSFKCLTCENGAIETVGNSKRCVCDESYYGAECKKNYNKIKCSNNGIYNKLTRSCNCYENYSGYNCNENTEFNCAHGLYNSELGKCICENGYYGDDCSNKVECIYGIAIEDICICNDHFSGVDCSIPRSETKQQRDIKNSHLQSFYEKPCKYGVYKNETDICDCFNGYTGHDCGTAFCKNGIYNSILNICECNKNYYGDRCELNCMEKCNYNGNMCNYRKECKCENNWFGETCDKIDITDERIIIQNSLEVNVKKSTNVSGSVDVEMIPCYSDNCIPFKLNQHIETSGIQRNVNSRRMLRNQNDESYVNIEIVIENEYVNSSYEAIYVYPDNNYTLSYYGGVSSIIIQNVSGEISPETYYFMIEPIRNTDITIHQTTENNDDDFGNDDLIYEQTTDVIRNSSETNDTTNHTNTINGLTNSTDISDMNNTSTYTNRTSNETTNESINESTETEVSQQNESHTNDNIFKKENTTFIASGTVVFCCIVCLALYVKKKQVSRNKKRELRKKKYVNNKTPNVVYTMNSIYFKQDMKTNTRV